MIMMVVVAVASPASFYTLGSVKLSTGDGHGDAVDDEGETKELCRDAAQPGGRDIHYTLYAVRCWLRLYCLSTECCESLKRGLVTLYRTISRGPFCTQGRGLARIAWTPV